MDLMFDIQVWRYRKHQGALPEAVLSSIASYYRRVTTEALPMGYAVGVVMSIAVLTLVTLIVRDPHWVTVFSLPFCVGPILLAMLRVFPNAVRLGARTDSPAQQSALARAICRDHFVCLGSILLFIALQLLVIWS